MVLKNSRIPLGRADALAGQAIREAHQAGLPFKDIIKVGGLRRCSPAVDGAALVAIVDDAHRDEVLSGFARLSLVRSVLGQTASHLRVSTDRGLLEVNAASPDKAGAALVWHTGTRRHAKWLQTRATAFGLTFIDGRLERNGNAPPHVPDEETFYRLIDLPYIPPELRDGEDEIVAAERGQLPSLIDTRHIRGDLHMHSTWSDGRDSIEAMVRAAQQLGYEYVAITDHSQRAFSSRKLAVADIAPQRDAILALSRHAAGP